jgi:hypothetical protein
VRVPGWLYPSAMVVMAVLMVLTHLNFQRQKELLRKNVDALQASLDKTVEVAPGVFERGAIEAKIDELESVSDSMRDLTARLESVNRRALAISEVLLTQKKVEGRAPARQVVERKKDPETGAEVERKRVDFSMDLSYYRISGHTVSDPAESYLVLEQVRPMPIIVSVSRSKDGKWYTDVKTDEGVRADVKLSVVDKKTVTGGWRESISVGVSGGVYPDPSVSVHALYGKNLALGPFCGLSEGAASCGVMALWRPFAR